MVFLIKKKVYLRYGSVCRLDSTPGVSKLFATGARFSIVKVVGANLFYI